MTAQRRPMPTTVRHEPEPLMLRVPIEIQSGDTKVRTNRIRTIENTLTCNENTEGNKQPEEVHQHVIPEGTNKNVTYW